MTRSIITVVLALAAPLCGAASGQVTVLHDFGAQLNDGEHPIASLLLATDGNFYGTTEGGGAIGDGSVFRVTHAGAVTVLHSFGSFPNDGAWPDGPLIQASDGQLYGATPVGGVSSRGTIYRISTLGAYLKLYDFGADGSDGAHPTGGLVQGGGGYLYGTTLWGGPYQDFDSTLYRISTAGEYSQLHAFGATPAEGKWPMAGLTVSSDGHLYGTTYFSGPREQPALQQGAGTVFKFAPGAGVTRLHEFGGADECPPDGASPETQLLRGADGNLYGTTRAGGTRDHGTVFKVTPNGTLMLLYEFGSIAADGREPAGRLMELQDGTLLGTTRFGGAHEGPGSLGGTAYALARDGTYTQLHSFGATETGAQWPEAGLTRGTDGQFYGVTVYGGSTADRANDLAGFGTFFRLTIDPAGTAPTVKYVPQVCSANPGVAGGGGALPWSLLLGLLLAPLYAIASRRLNSGTGSA